MSKQRIETEKYSIDVGQKYCRFDGRIVDVVGIAEDDITGADVIIFRSPSADLLSIEDNLYTCSVDHFTKEFSKCSIF